MSLSIDRDLLRKTGLADLSEEDSDSLLKAIIAELQLRVGEQLVELMSLEDLDRFERANLSSPEEANEVLESAVPDYPSRVTAILNELWGELASRAGDILEACAGASDQNPGPLAPETAPTVIGNRSGSIWVTSRSGATTVFSGRDGRTLHGRHRDQEPTVLLVPGNHRLERRTLHCSDSGNVRVTDDTGSEILWKLAGERRAALIGRHDEPTPRPYLDIAEPEAHRRGEVRLENGPWVVVDAWRMKVSNIRTGAEFRLEPLCDLKHANAFTPRFSPDGSQLVAGFNSTEGDKLSGIAVCTTEYLARMADREDTGDDPVPWEWRAAPTAPSENPPGTGNHVVQTSGHITGFGYDRTGQRVAVKAGRWIRTYDVSDWSEVSTIAKADGSVRVERVELPFAKTTAMAWAGSSVVLTDDSGGVWQVNLSGSHAAAIHLDASVPRDPPLAAAHVRGTARLIYPDRTVLSVTGSGKAEESRLGTGAPPSAAALLTDGRILISTEHGMELWSGERLLAETAYAGPPIAGLARCEASPDWAIAWHVDHSVSTLRLGVRTIRTKRNWIPHMPQSDAFELRAAGAIMIDVDDWWLIGLAGGSMNDGRPYLAGPTRFEDLDVAQLVPLGFLGTAAAAAGNQIEVLQNGRLRAHDPNAGLDTSPLLAGSASQKWLAACTTGELRLYRLL